MELKDFDKESFEVLLAAAKAPDAKQIDVDTVGAWYECYGTKFWDGKGFVTGGGKRLVPLHDKKNGKVRGYAFEQVLFHLWDG